MAKNVDEANLADLLRDIEGWSQGIRDVESLPNMLRHLHHCVGRLSVSQQAGVLVALLKAFSEGVGTPVAALVAALAGSGALGGTVLSVEVPMPITEGAECSCPRCTREHTIPQEDLN